MLDESPHTLYKRTLASPEYDEYGRPMTDAEETWEEVGECFCHDNTQMREVSVNGRMWTYNYHIVYEGEKIPLGTTVRCTDASGNTVGEGEVVKHTICYSEDLAGRCDIWI